MIVWTNHGLSSKQHERLLAAVAPHHLVQSTAQANAAGAEVLFGQPPLEVIEQCKSLRWIQVTSAGYGRYAPAAELFVDRGVILTKSSEVFARPCAEHALAFILAQTRQLMPAWERQEQRRWDPPGVRSRCQLLAGQSVALVGLGQIGLRLAELLGPLGPTLVGLRRNPAGDEGMPVHRLGSERGDEALAKADHVVNLLPGVSETEGFFDRARLGRLKRGAAFYNVGRGTTVDQVALAQALKEERLTAAWLDVADPEPLPAEHPLWAAPRCYITPHAAGGRQNESDVLLQHFVDNFARYAQGQPLVDQVRWPVKR